MKKNLFTLALFMLLGLTPLVPQAHAWVGVRFGIGVPIYVGPGPYYYGYPYYYPPTYVTPSPQVVYQPAPSNYSVPQGPVLKEPLPAPSQKDPLPSPQTNASGEPVSQNAAPVPLPAMTNVLTVNNQSSSPLDSLVRQLSQADVTVRRDAAIQLGRMKASSAVDALVHILAKDTSPIAREGAARALGLIASPTSLNSLIYAAQADDDREVRHSAQFAVEVIRSNLRGK